MSAGPAVKSGRSRAQLALVGAGLLALLLVACGDRPTEPAPDPSPASESPSEKAAEAEAATATPGAEMAPILLADQDLAYVEVAEAFLTVASPELNLDSPAAWQQSDGSMWLYATSKAAGMLLIYDGDTGLLKGSGGSKGEGAGEFNRPNGIFAINDLLLVVERDNRRVQVLRLPGLQPLGFFGADALRSPYGIWVRSQGEGYEAFVSDSFMDGADYDQVPPMQSLDKRYRRYRLWVEGDTLRAEESGTFGATDPAGAIHMAESVWGDEVQGRLMLAEEYPPIGSRVRIYDMEGNYSGQDLGAELFRAQAEGISLWQCSDGSGYWITTDQFKDRSLFHIFDRQTLAHRGSFAGLQTANTDGIWLHQAPTRAFPDGVLYAVHDDQAVAAFDWRAIAEALAIRADCQQ